MLEDLNSSLLAPGESLLERYLRVAVQLKVQLTTASKFTGLNPAPDSFGRKLRNFQKEKGLLMKCPAAVAQLTG
jgi:hypothetical protein